jgi:hypothetical protein
MAGVMLVKQKVGCLRREHGLVVTGSYADADNPNIVIVVMDMHDLDKARRFAASVELATAREQAGAIGSPDGVWFGPHQIQEPAAGCDSDAKTQVRQAITSDVQKSP